MQHEFTAPPVSRTADGAERRVGFELEFSGVSLERAIAAVAEALDGEIKSETAAECTIAAPEFGDFVVEIDWSYLKRKAAEDEAQPDDSRWLETLSQAAALVVPLEVVCPPLGLSDLPVLEPVVRSLRNAGAVGTDESLAAADGVHVNAEIPRLDAPTIFAYLRAFALLQWWLVDAHDVDVARRLSPYVNLYPEAYLERVASMPNANLDEIFADYLTHNATRNRALDLLPLLAEIDEARVKESVDDPRIKARPAFHYRLPNCHIEQPDWSLDSAWNTWCVVERVATNAALLDELAAAFIESERPVLGVSRANWVAHVDKWLRDHALV